MVIKVNDSFNQKGFPIDNSLNTIMFDLGPKEKGGSGGSQGEACMGNVDSSGNCGIGDPCGRGSVGGSGTCGGDGEGCSCGGGGAGGGGGCSGGDG